jgi:hypothetical protein
MEFSKEARLMCGALSEFQLPRAIAHIGKDRLIAWNESFRSIVGYSDAGLQSASFKEVAILGDFQPGAEETRSDLATNVEVVPVRFRTLDTENFATGHAAKRDDGFVLLMLDVLDKSTGLLEDARVFGREEERSRILKIFHDKVSPKLLAAIFEVARAKEELESKGLQRESESVARASTALVETIDTLANFLDSDKPESREADK